MLGVINRDGADDRTLVGRDDALRHLDDAVARAAAGRATRTVVAGAAGSGRTALLDELVRRTPGVVVLRSNPVAAEAALAHAGLFDLCQPVAHLVGELPATSARVLEGALGLGPAGSWGPMAVGAALLALLARAAHDQPVLLVLDDADQADTETLDAVLFAVRRLADDRIGVVLAAGPHLAARLSAAGGFERVGLVPLDRDEAAVVLERSCPVAPDPAVRERLLDVAQGNPLALTLLPRSLSLPQIKGRWPLPDPLPSAERLADVVAADLDALDDDGRAVLLIVATSLTGTRAAILAAGAALDLRPDAVDDLVRSGHLVVDGPRLRFARPLVRSVAYARADPAERRRAHTALAEVLGAEVGLEQRAWHLSAAAVGPDAAAADLLEQAARLLAGRGASSGAAATLDRAVALTASRAVRARRRVAAAEALLAIGETERARVHLECAEGESNDAEVLVAARHLLGRVLVNQGAGTDGQSVLAAGGRMARAHEPKRAVLMLCEAALAAVHGRRFGEAAALAEEARSVAAGAGVEGPSQALAGLVWGAVAVARGDTRAGRSALRTNLAGLDIADAATTAAPVFDGVAMALVWAERYREARRLLDAVIEERRRVVALGLLPPALALRALLGHRVGDTVRAFADAVEALRLMDGDDGQASRASALAMLSSVESTIGLRAACLEHVRQCLAALGDRGRGSTLRIGALSAAASVELSCGAPDAALEWLAPLIAADEAAVAAKGNPATVMWEPDLVEALHQAGRTAEALERLDAFEARATAANNQRGLGAAARCRGQLLADDAASDAAFAASVEHYRPAHPVGMGRTWLAWGERLVASGRRAEAVERLERALHHLDEAGAGAWAARAAALLEEAGAGPVDRRPPLVDLAPEVAEVALLTAAGFDVDKVANHVLASRRTVLRLLADATAALGEHPGPGLLRHLGDASTLGPGDADDDVDADADERPSATPPLAVVGTRALRVLGRFDVRDGGRDVTPPPGLGARLVKLLAVSGPAGVTVDEAVELLWPELDPAKGRTRLRNVLSRLRSTSGELVVRAGDGLRLADGVDVDLARFAALGAQAQRTAAAGGADAPALTKEALAIYGGDVLPDSPYEAWAAAPRERARRRVVDLLDLLARHHRASGRLDDAVAVVERAIAIDVYDEERYIFAAELRREQGRHGAAMALLQRARVVVADLGLAPSPRLVEVERSLRRPARPTD